MAPRCCSALSACMRRRRLPAHLLVGRVRSGLIAVHECARIARGVQAVGRVRTCGAGPAARIAWARCVRRGHSGPSSGRGVMFSTWPVARCVLGHHVAARAEDDIRVERIRDDVAVLDHPHGVPVAIGDLAVVAAAGDADRAAFLLSGAQPVGIGGVTPMWYSCAVGWLNQELQLRPPLTRDRLRPDPLPGRCAASPPD